jgi:hypothetical protein
MGMTTPDNAKHLGIFLGRTMDSTVEVTMANIEPKLVKRRILATTPPTDVLHRATLVTTALIPVYNHVFRPSLLNPSIQNLYSLRSYAFSGPSKWMAIPSRKGAWWRRRGSLLDLKWEALAYNILLKSFKAFSSTCYRKSTSKAECTQLGTFPPF